MKKTTLVRTDDPEKPKFTLTVTGEVDRVVTIKPKSVYLQGSQGDTLETTVDITPSQKYQFAILGLEQRVNKNIKASLVAPQGSEKSWQIKVKAESENTGQVYDLLTLKTDSKYLPSFSIRVYAKFSAKKESGS
ncbi:MAG: hypothetical protein PF690_16860 [Deltaproteobacteria bacterium]|jgi:hypothetical protein|nr:hypothetical protein [Deltaproteobacteria bacterium]